MPLYSMLGVADRYTRVQNNLDVLDLTWEPMRYFEMVLQI